MTLPLDNVTKLRSEWFFSSDSIDRTGHFFPMPIRKDEKDSRSKRGRKWIDCVIFQIIKHRNVFCLGSHRDILTCPTKSTEPSYDTIEYGSSLLPIAEPIASFNHSQPLQRCDSHFYETQADTLYCQPNDTIKYVSTLLLIASPICFF